jgi:fructokinase
METLCVGEILWDLLPSGAKEGGAPMNVAIHMKKLGHDARFAGRVGNDAMGRSLASFLIKHGIDTSLLQIDHLLPTGTVEVNLTNENDVSFSIVDNVAYDNMSVDTDLLHVAEESDAIVYGTLASRHEHTRETILKLLDATPGIKVVDVNLRPPYDSREVTALMLSKADIAKLNDNELKTISEWYNIDLPEKETMEWFTDRFRLKLVCLTKGAKGAMIYDAVNKKSFTHDGYKVKVVDTVGAGDAFLSGFLVYYLDKKSLEESLTLANAVGALVASKSGGTPEYTLKEVVKIIRGQQIKVTTREFI